MTMENDSSAQQLDPKSEYDLKRKKKLEEQRLLQRKRMMKRLSTIALVALILAGGIGALGWYIAKQPQNPPSELISRNGIHWHPHLAIFIHGKQQEIPANIGLGVTEQPIHTHDASGTLHLEYSGFVTKDDTKLGKFFKIWGKRFNSTCIFDFCNGPNGAVEMFVNGQPNKEFEQYPMRGGDQIEIRYEQNAPSR